MPGKVASRITAISDRHCKVDQSLLKGFESDFWQPAPKQRSIEGFITYLEQGLVLGYQEERLRVRKYVVRLRRRRSSGDHLSPLEILAV